MRKVLKRLAAALAVVLAIAVIVDFGSSIFAEYRLARSVRAAAGLNWDPSAVILGFPFIPQAVARRYGEVEIKTNDVEHAHVGKASLDNLSGPISIASAAGQTARIGLEAFLRFLAIVSLSLGVINLLPLPLLDGGHLMYYFVEILTGKPISAERQALFQRFGVFLLGSLMFIAVFNDLQRLFNW